jgi:hypothetical protein
MHAFVSNIYLQWTYTEQKKKSCKNNRIKYKKYNFVWEPPEDFNPVPPNFDQYWFLSLKSFRKSYRWSSWEKSEKSGKKINAHTPKNI